MKLTKVTDPAILAQLNAGSKKVTDPEILKQLNSEPEEEIPYTPPPPRTGFSGIWEDIKDIPGKAFEYGIDIPYQATASGSQLVNKPGRALANLLSGAGGLAKGLVNLPHESIKYLGEKEIIPEWLKEYNETGMRIPFTNKHIPTYIGDIGFNKLTGLDKQEAGDQFLRDLPGLYAGGKTLLSIPGVKEAGKRIIAQKNYRALKKKSEEIEGKHEEAVGEQKAATEEYNALKSFLESQLGFEGSNPNILKRKASEAQQKLDALRAESEATPEYLKATTEPIAPEKAPLSLIEPIKPGEKLEISDEPVKQAESLLKTNEQKSAELEKQFGEGHLKKGYTHDVPIAEGVTKKISENKKEIGNIYDEVQGSLEDKHIVIPRSEQLLEAEKESRKLLESSRAFFKTDEEFEAAVKKLAKGYSNTKRGPSDIVPAADVLSNYRTMRHLSQKLNKEAYSSKVAGNKDLQSEMLSKADEFETNAQNLETLLENNDLGDSLKNLKVANKRWREEITPLYRNKTYKQFLNGLGPDNIMKALRGNGPGQEIIRKIIKEDPELLRNIIGQRYANNPAKLHEFDELTHEYTQHMPEVQEFRKQHFESKQAENQSKMALERVRHEYQTQREQADIAHLKAIEEAKEQTRQKKAAVHKENLTKDEEYKGKTKYYKNQQEIKELDEKITKLTNHAKQIKEKANRKEINLKQKLDLEHEHAKIKKQLDKLQKDRSALKRIGKILGYGAVTVAVGTPIYNKARSLINIGK